MSDVGPRAVRFRPGTVVVTLGAPHIATTDEIHALLTRHPSGDWGDVDAEANEHALKHGLRVLSSSVVRGEELRVVTGADRSAPPC